jgi:multiple sugar transport system substrate-binding protein
LGGQNHIALFKESAAKIDMKNACAYDQGCNEQMQGAMKDYFNGTTASLADAIAAFKTKLNAKYTGLTYDSSFDITTL